MKSINFLISLFILLTIKTAYSDSLIKSSDIEAQCDYFAAQVNADAQGALVDFSFTNFLGYSQKSSARVRVRDTSYCVSGNEKSFLTLERTDIPDVTVTIMFKHNGKGGYSTTIVSSNCTELFADFAKDSMEKAGRYFDAEYELHFYKNMRTEYCPKFEAAVVSLVLSRIK